MVGLHYSEWVVSVISVFILSVLTYALLTSTLLLTPTHGTDGKQ